MTSHDKTDASVISYGKRTVMVIVVVVPDLGCPILKLVILHNYSDPIVDIKLPRIGSLLTNIEWDR